MVAHSNSLVLMSVVVTSEIPVLFLTVVNPECLVLLSITVGVGVGVVVVVVVVVGVVVVVIRWFFCCYS